MKMKAHKQKHKQKECKICSLLVFANSWSSHQSKCSETELQCKLCSFETSQKSNLQAHIKSIHEGTQMYAVQGGVTLLILKSPLLTVSYLTI